MATNYTYLPADEYAVYHEDDSVLHTIRVRLPKPPPEKEIDGYGLNPRKQMFHRVEIPKRLKALERSCVNIDEVWEKLNHYKLSYEEEIAFIKREWDRRIHGYWFFNNGKPTYIDGWHYFYLTYWKIDVGYPDYRDRDRRFFIFIRYAYTTTEAFYPYRAFNKKTERLLGYFNNEKEANRFVIQKGNDDIIAERGDFIVDLHRRTCIGVNYPKYRREGATYKAQNINFCVISMLESASGGIQSMDGKHAAEAFEEKLVAPWKKVPFFFMPRYSGTTDPKKKLEFDVPAVRIGGKGSMLNIGTGLESKITFAETAQKGAFDGKKLRFLNNDEIGKTIEADVDERHSVQKKCSTLGNTSKIVGLELNTSTVGEMSKNGGVNFLSLCNKSMWNIRDASGQTESGLFNLFISSYDNLEGFIDIFGISIIDDPLEKDVWKWENPYRDSLGRLRGAKNYLDSKVEEVLLRDDAKSIADYEEEIRQSPIQFNQCFITAGAGSGLDIKKISRRIRELQFDKGATRTGNFKWENNFRDTNVFWEDDEINGRFKISLELNSTQANLKTRSMGKDMNGEDKEFWIPIKPWMFTASADPYEFIKTVSRKMGREGSLGAGTVFMERDKTIDSDDKSVYEWKTYRTVCTYLYRPKNPDDYAEDMLMMCVYYGAMMFPERNIPSIWNYFVRRGYDGYLKYSRDINGKWATTPGYFNRGAIPQRIMQLHQNYIDNFIMLERHIDILYQQKAIRGVNEQTNYDLFVAFGGALLGSETDYAQFFDKEEKEDDGIDVSIFMH